MKFIIFLCDTFKLFSLKACPHQATNLPKTAANCYRKQQRSVAVSGNNVAVFGDYSFGNNLLPFSATLLPGVDRPLVSYPSSHQILATPLGLGLVELVEFIGK